MGFITCLWTQLTQEHHCSLFCAGPGFGDFSSPLSSGLIGCCSVSLSNKYDMESKDCSNVYLPYCPCTSLMIKGLWIQFDQDVHVPATSLSHFDTVSTPTSMLLIFMYIENCWMTVMAFAKSHNMQCLNRMYKYFCTKCSWKNLQVRCYKFIFVYIWRRC